MTLYLHAAHRRAPKHTGTFSVLREKLLAKYGRVPPHIGMGVLDLNLCGLAFRHIVGCQAVPSTLFIHRQDMSDLWPTIQGERFEPGRGYEEWAWGATYHFLDTAWFNRLNIRLRF